LRLCNLQSRDPDRSHRRPGFYSKQNPDFGLPDLNSLYEEFYWRPVTLISGQAKVSDSTSKGFFGIAP